MGENQFIAMAIQALKDACPHNAPPNMMETFVSHLVEQIQEHRIKRAIQRIKHDSYRTTHLLEMEFGLHLLPTDSEPILIDTNHD